MGEYIPEQRTEEDSQVPRKVILVAAILMDRFFGQDDRLAPMDHNDALRAAKNICGALDRAEESQVQEIGRILERLSVVDPVGSQLLENLSRNRAS